MSDKPREWWPKELDGKHVIEYSAYETQLKRAEANEERAQQAIVAKNAALQERDELDAILANHKLYEDYQYQIDVITKERNEARADLAAFKLRLSNTYVETLERALVIARDEALVDVQKLIEVNRAGIAGWKRHNARSAKLVEALDEAQKWATKKTLTEAEWDYLCGKVFREALADYKNGFEKIDVT